MSTVLTQLNPKYTKHLDRFLHQDIYFLQIMMYLGSVQSKVCYSEGTLILTLNEIEISTFSIANFVSMNFFPRK